jgi:hypothetical protein
MADNSTMRDTTKGASQIMSDTASRSQHGVSLASATGKNMFIAYLFWWSLDLSAYIGFIWTDRKAPLR